MTVGAFRGATAILLVLTACGSNATSQDQARTPCRYRFPVQPASKVKYGPYHHHYPATDIYAARGSRYIAPTSGTVDFVSWTDPYNEKEDDPAERGGISIAFIGDDGVRYYGSHLLEISGGLRRGDRVTVGEQLGKVGSSGNAKGLRPHLHFGISHPTSPTDWQTRRGLVAPFGYLNAWRRGAQITPRVPKARKPSCTPVR